MRLEGIIPVLLTAAALVLSFLCLFAGSKKGFMEDYAVVTLNTSRIGENLDLFGLDLRKRDNSNGEDQKDVGSWIESAGKNVTAWLEGEGHNITSSLEGEIHNLTNSIENALKNDINDLARALGVYDFYSAHVLDFCEGFYVPGPVANATIKQGSIHKNVTACSNKTALYHFDPTTTIAQQLNDSTDGLIDLSKVKWPEDITNGLHALRVAQKAVFVLYCIAIGLLSVAFILAIAGIFFGRRLMDFINVTVDFLAIVAILIPSAIVTYIADHATHLINKYGNDIGVSATRGSKFLVLTWVATGLVFIASIVWSFACLRGRHERSGKRNGDEKHGYRGH